MHSVVGSVKLDERTREIQQQSHGQFDELRAWLRTMQCQSCGKSVTSPSVELKTQEEEGTEWERAAVTPKLALGSAGGPAQGEGGVKGGKPRLQKGGSPKPREGRRAVMLAATESPARSTHITRHKEHSKQGQEQRAAGRELMHTTTDRHDTDVDLTDSHAAGRVTMPTTCSNDPDAELTESHAEVQPEVLLEVGPEEEGASTALAGAMMAEEAKELPQIPSGDSPRPHRSCTPGGFSPRTPADVLTHSDSHGLTSQEEQSNKGEVANTVTWAAVKAAVENEREDRARDGLVAVVKAAVKNEHEDEAGLSTQSVNGVAGKQRDGLVAVVRERQKLSEALLIDQGEIDRRLDLALFKVSFGY